MTEIATARKAGAREEAIIIFVLGMVIKGMDLTLRDLTRMGFNRMTVYRAIKFLETAGFIHKVTRNGYAFTDRAKAVLRKLAREDLSQFSGPSIFNFIFTAYQMSEWSADKMDKFLNDFRRDWELRIRRI